MQIVQGKCNKVTLNNLHQAGLNKHTVKEDIMKLKSDDDVVIWEGSNDIGKNNSKEALKHLCNFVKNNQTLW